MAKRNLNADPVRVGLIAGLFGVMTSAPVLASPVDPVLFWNDQVLAGIRAVETSPTMSAHDIAILNIAIYDAVNAATGQRYKPYAFMGGAVLNADSNAAAFQAGWDTMIGLFPSIKPSIDAAAHSYRDLLGYTVPATSAVTNGVNLGSQTAGTMMTHRASDHSTDPQPVFTGGIAPAPIA